MAIAKRREPLQLETMDSISNAIPLATAGWP
jgi:hypothetical protein